MNRDVLDRALATKRDYARETGTDLWIVTQFVFSGKTTVEWLCRVRELAGPLSIRLGIPGPARLLGHWTPDGLLRDLAGRRGSGQQSLFDGIHVFPFGGIAHCTDWLRRLAGEPHMVRSKSDREPNSILSDRR